MALRKTKELSAPNATGNAGLSLSARLGVPSPDAKVRHWHVAPWVDTIAYAFSWLPFLAVVAFLGDSQRDDYIYGYLIVLAFTDVVDVTDPAGVDMDDVVSSFVDGGGADGVDTLTLVSGTMVMITDIDGTLDSLQDVIDNSLINSLST